MTAPRPRFVEIEIAAGNEWAIAHGDPAAAVRLLIVPPLFEELNRMRRMIGDVMRALAAQGVASMLPDLPGTGESVRALEGIGWGDWLDFIPAAARASGATHVASLRGGALLDHAAGLPLWRFQPTEGALLLRDMTRARALSDPAFDEAAKRAIFEEGPTELAGYRVSAGLARTFRDAKPVAVDNARVARLATDAKPADIKLPGAPLWRRAEPGSAPELSEAIAADLFAWMASC